MELVYLVYGISLLGSIGPFLVASITVLVTCLAFTILYRLLGLSIETYDSMATINRKKAEVVTVEKWLQRMAITLATFIVFIIAIPSEKTAYMMVGAYAAQKVAENEKVQATGQKVLTIIEQKLDTYIDSGMKDAQKKVEQLKDKK